MSVQVDHRRGLRQADPGHATHEPIAALSSRADRGVIRQDEQGRRAVEDIEVRGQSLREEHFLELVEHGRFRRAEQHQLAPDDA